MPRFESSKAEEARLLARVALAAARPDDHPPDGCGFSRDASETACQHSKQIRGGLITLRAALRHWPRCIAGTELDEDRVDDIVLVTEVVVEVPGRDVHLFRDDGGRDIRFAKLVEQA